MVPSECMAGEWPNGIVFTVSHPRDLPRSFKRLLDSAKLKRFGFMTHVIPMPHSLFNVVPVELVSKRLERSSVNFALDTYRRLYRVERREAAVSLGNLLGVTTWLRAVNQNFPAVKRETHPVCEVRSSRP